MQDWIAPDSFPRELTRGQKLLKTVNQRPEDFVLVKEYKNQDQMCFILKDLKSPIQFTFLKTFGIPPIYGCKPDFGFSSKEISGSVVSITHRAHILYSDIYFTPFKS